MIADRRGGFCYQTHEALDAIRACVEAEEKLKLPTALAVYLVLTETANRVGGEQARNGFRASRSAIAREVGCSVDTLDRYIAAFVESGLLAVERERGERGNLPNLWGLLDAPSRTGAARGSRTGAAGGSRTGAAHELLEEDLDQEPPTSPPPLPAKVDRVSVSAREGELAVAVLSAYNDLTGQSFAGKDWIAKIVMRIREHPELDLDAHQRVLEVAFRDPWWKGRPAPSVIYGNAALFEKCLDAASAAPLRVGDGQTRQGTKFGRRDVSAGELLAIADQLEQKEEIDAAV